MAISPCARIGTYEWQEIFACTSPRDVFSGRCVSKNVAKALSSSVVIEAIYKRLFVDQLPPRLPFKLLSTMVTRSYHSHFHDLKSESLVRLGRNAFMTKPGVCWVEQASGVYRKVTGNRRAISLGCRWRVRLERDFRLSIYENCGNESILVDRITPFTTCSTGLRKARKLLAVGEKTFAFMGRMRPKKRYPYFVKVYAITHGCTITQIDEVRIKEKKPDRFTVTQQARSRPSLLGDNTISIRLIKGELCIFKKKALIQKTHLFYTNYWVVDSSTFVTINDYDHNIVIWRQNDCAQFVASEQIRSSIKLKASVRLLLLDDLPGWFVVYDEHSYVMVCSLNDKGNYSISQQFVGGKELDLDNPRHNGWISHKHVSYLGQGRLLIESENGAHIMLIKKRVENRLSHWERYLEALARAFTPGFPHWSSSESF